mmetsp:Transcript_14198/g.38236  ORF Transcript_14198/g.38236 Transcript_14198/m.38236 type:complete len:247 (-) Transcript_14198:1069-1809(-)
MARVCRVEACEAGNGCVARSASHSSAILDRVSCLRAVLSVYPVPTGDWSRVAAIIGMRRVHLPAARRALARRSRHAAALSDHPATHVPRGDLGERCDEHAHLEEEVEWRAEHEGRDEDALHEGLVVDGLEECAGDQHRRLHKAEGEETVQGKRPDAGRVDDAENGRHDGANDGEKGEEPAHGQHVEQAQLAAAGDGPRPRHVGDMVQRHLLPAHGPAQALAVERAQGRGRELARPRAGAEANALVL